MRWSEYRSWLLPALLCALASCGSEPLPPLPGELPDDPFAQAALQARVDRVRPTVESLIGEPLGSPVRVVVADRAEWADHCATTALTYIPPDAPVTDIERTWHLVRAQALYVHARLLYASVWHDDDAIWLVPENFSSVPAELLGDLLDVVLAHELVHVHQYRTLALSSPEQLGEQPDEAQLAVGTVAEGHAQWVARRVAKRLKLNAAFAHIVAPEIEPPAATNGSWAIHFWHEHLALFDFKYRTGEEFVAQVIDAVGYDEAMVRLFHSPPRRIRTILAPEEWIERRVEREDRGDAAVRGRLIQALEIANGAGYVQLPPVVGLGLADLDAPRTKAVLASLEVSERFNVKPTEGSLRGVVGTVELSRFDSVDAANEYLAARREALTIRGTPCYLGSEVHHVAGHSAASQDREAVLHVRLSHLARAEPVAAHVALLAAGSDVLQVTMPACPRGARATARLARRLGTILTDDSSKLLAGASGASPDALLTLMSDPDPDVRLIALVALGDAAEPKETRTLLLRMLGDSDTEVRAQALALLAESATDQEVSRRLLAELRNPRSDVRDLAARHLAAAAREPGEIRFTLIEALCDPDGTVREAAFSAAVEADFVSLLPQELLLRLSSDANPRLPVAIATYFIDPDHWESPHRAAVLLPMTEHSSADVRRAAWSALRFDQEEGVLSRAVIDRGLGDASPLVRSAALDAVTPMFGSGVGLTEAQKTRILAKALSDDDCLVRSTAIYGVGDLKKEGSRFVPMLIHLLDDPDHRPSVIFTLGQLHEDAAPAARALGQIILEHKDCAAAAKTIGKIGKPARVAIEPLRALTTSPHARTHIAAVLALHKLGEGSREMAESLSRHLSHPASVVRGEAMEALADLNAATPEVITALRQGLVAQLPSSRSVALKALLGMKDVPEDAMHEAAQLLKDPDEGVRREAWYKFSATDAERGPARTILTEFLATGTPEEKRDAVDLLSAMGDRTEEMVPALILCLEGEADWNTGQVAEVLGEIGESAHSAVPALLALVNSEERFIRRRVIPALAKIQPVADDTLKAIAERLLVEWEGYVLSDIFKALRSVERDMGPALPSLRKALASDDEDLVRHTCKLVARLRERGVDLEAALTPLLKHSSKDVRDWAAFALRAIRAEDGRGEDDDE